MKLQKVGIAGCGVMGAGIAQVVLSHGYQVTILEADKVTLEKGVRNVQHGIETMLKKRIISSEDYEKALNRLSGTVCPTDLADCDLIIEAVFEDLQTKTTLLKALDSICKRHTIFASNTSSFSISKMAAATSRPERVIGLHFFNPVPVMTLVEIIRTIVTDLEVINTMMDFTKSLEKVPILVKDRPGFLVNSLLTPFLMGAIRALEDGVASVREIDLGITLGCNHPMGPLMLADVIGLDVLLEAGNAMYEEYKEPKYAPAPLLKNMVALGLLGKKTGKGFYDWSDPRNPVPMDLRQTQGG